MKLRWCAAFVFSAACGHPAGAPLDPFVVEFGGCEAVTSVRGVRTCEITPKTSLRFWILAPPEAELSVHTGTTARPLEPRALHGGWAIELAELDASKPVTIAANTRDARASFALELALYPRSPLLEKAEALRQQGRLDESQALLLRLTGTATATPIERARATGKLARISNVAGRSEEAVLRFREAIRLDRAAGAVSDAVFDGLVLSQVFRVKNQLADARAALAAAAEDARDFPQAHAIARRGLARLDIPAEAVELREAQAVRPLATVGDRHRPLRGGLQIQNSNGGICTLGFIAVRNSVAGFVTNSHCTNTQGGVENTVISQPLNSDSVGTEIADPSYFTGGVCPAQCGYGVPVGTCRCRYSDSAFIDLDGANGSRSIARNPVGSLEWDGTSRYPVVNEAAAFVGLSVRKIGRTTGHTFGLVNGTCVDFGQTGSRNTILCQTQADTLESGSGDSGSPVFRTTSCTVNGQPDSCANLFGILWGAGVFSPISNVQMSGELGAVDPCATAGGC